MPVAPGATVLACDSCGTRVHGRPASRQLQDPDWVALPPKAKLRYADDTAEMLVAPDALVPFRIERATARRLLRDWARGRWFTPRAFRRIDESESFRGAFLPFWVWDARTRSRYKAARGEHYWSQAGGGGRVRGVRWLPAAGRVDRDFTAVPVAATARLEGRALSKLLRDWTIDDAVPFEARMLDGYWVQRYDIEPEVGLELAKARMAAAVEGEVRYRVGGDEQHVPTIETAYSGLAYRLVLLPVWLVSHPHRGRRRMVAVHGESGRVVGMRPWSVAKLVITAALTLGVAGAILFFGRLSLSPCPAGPLGGRGIAYAECLLYGSWNATRQLSCACIPRSVPASPRLRRGTPRTVPGEAMGSPMKHAAAKASSPWWAKTMVVVGSTVMVVSGGGAIAAQVSVSTLEDSVNQANLLDDQRVEIEEGAEITGPLNFLVLGTDERVDAGGEARTDANIIVHVNKDLTQVSMISLPRDLYVEIPSGTPASETKLTEAFAYSEDWGESFQNTAETITNLTGIEFNGGAIANFEGFLDMVDELGTIELCPWHEIKSIHTDKVFPKGCAEYGKKDALDLVRQRYGWDSPEDVEQGIWGDFGRQKMQQQAIKKILERAKEQGYVTDPTKAVNLLSTFGDALTLDTGNYQLIDLITQMRDVDPAEIVSIGTPSSAGDINGTSYVVIHEGTEEETAAAELWDAIANDTIDEWACANDEWLSGDSKPDCAATTAPVDGGSAAEESPSDGETAG
ncbi:LCP family protein [Glycomyces rhizosphaerae]|uniref:LCP family protein n=1 Tax=Glycomyces rhizosphaerae TaxID=2054422 RepID=A0ABV7Q192_9ACTN